MQVKEKRIFLENKIKIWNYKPTEQLEQNLKQRLKGISKLKMDMKIYTKFNTNFHEEQKFETNSKKHWK